VSRSRRGAATAALAATILAVCGCGGGATRFSGSEPPPPGGGGELRYALPAVPAALDPLAASSNSERTVVRQLFEPLVGDLSAPYRPTPPRRGLALGWRHSRDFRIWSFRLRPGVRFQDGALFNAAAVLANADRWRTASVGQSLLPGLVAADAPRPDLARLILAQPMRDLARRLRDPRLGLVSPDVLRPGSAVLAREERAGSGPFVAAARSPASIVLSRNRGWWGSRFGLGPALDRVVFTATPGPFERLSRLRDGAVRVAAELDPRDAAQLRRDPLLTVKGTRSGHPVGLERSVRGIRDWRAQPLSGVWLALLQQS
jgi:peptide/nickel transport system substrate-binding protein